MGHKLSRVPVESPYRRQTTVTSDVDKTYQNTSTGQPLLTTTGAQTTHVTTSAATAGLLAALRWKKVTHQRRNRRSAAERANKTAYNAGISDMPQQAQSVASGNTGVWAKLFRHLSRKMTAGRRRQRVGRPNMYGVDHPDGSRSGALKGPATRAGGTSSVLPVSRNPVTSVIAYADNLGGDLPQHEKDSTDVNSNVADIVRRITISSRCAVRHDVTDSSKQQVPVTSSAMLCNAPCSTEESQPAQKPVPRKTIQIQASTGELLAGLGEFLRCRCRRLRHFDGSEVAVWLRAVDRSLIEHAWQDIPFVGPANLVLVYLLACDAVDPDIITVGELQAIIMACLYVAFSYAGSEISYPLKPFISSAGVDEVTSHSGSGGPGKKRFWNRCLTIVERSSGEMLRLNREPAYFAELFRELKTYASSSLNYMSSRGTSMCRSRDMSSGQSNGVVTNVCAAKHRLHDSEE